jgi:hypothetical protein
MIRRGKKLLSLIGRIALLGLGVISAVAVLVSQEEKRDNLTVSRSLSQIRLLPDPSTVVHKVISSPSQLPSRSQPHSRHMAKTYRGKVVSYSLHQTPLNSIQVLGKVQCPANSVMNKELKGKGYRGWSGSDPRPNSYPNGILNQTGVLDFKASISTKLNIIVVGDSISFEGFWWLRDALGTIHTENINWRQHGNGQKLRAGFCRTPHGGSVAFMLAESMLLPEIQGQKWFREDATALQNALEKQTYDVCINRIPVPHIPFTDINTANLERHFENLKRFFKCNLIIVTNIAWHNNMMNERTVSLYYEKNSLLRSFIRDKGENLGLALLDMDTYTRQLIEENARGIGLDENEVYAARLPKISSGWGPLISMVCRHRLLRNKIRCWPNKLTSDGMHWCPEALAARSNAVVACIMTCYFDPSIELRKLCTSTCNDDFQTLKPVIFDEVQHEYPAFGDHAEDRKQIQIT